MKSLDYRINNVIEDYLGKKINHVIQPRVSQSIITAININKSNLLRYQLFEIEEENQYTEPLLLS